MLAGIPSIVYGFFGMVVLVPFLKNFSPNDVGEGVLASSIILAIMILPTITSITRYNLEAVYKYYYDGARALGNTHSQAIFGVIVKAAKSGIFSAIVLGMGRAIGETMAVMMVIGNSLVFPTLLGKAETIASLIALEIGMSEVRSLHYSALFASGAILMLTLSIINIAVHFLRKYLLKLEL